MDQSTHPEFHDRIQRLERRVRFLWGIHALVVVGLLGVACTGLGMHQSLEDAVLTVRGLVITDMQGRPRVLLGAPIPKVRGRSRTDEVAGVVVVGENGADRVQVGNLGGPQMNGVTEERVSPEAGIMVNDPMGNERGGFGAFDDGRVVLGLDYPDREAISLAVLPQEGAAGVWLNGPAPQGWERAGLVVTRAGQSLLKLADLSGTERVVLLVDGDAAAQLLLRDSNDHSMVDALRKIAR